MASSAGTPDVGAIDPQLKTSPVLEQTAEEPYGPRQAVAGDACFFNGERFATGEFVRSGPVVLECRGGLWVEIGPADPLNRQVDKLS
jgi:hypothetical protein